MNMLLFLRSSVTEKGIKELVSYRSISLTRPRPKADSSSLVLGFHALINDLEMTLEEYAKFAEAAGEDHGVGETIHLAFIDALKTARIQFGEE
jgi:hypothetical protein